MYSICIIFMMISSMSLAMNAPKNLLKEGVRMCCERKNIKECALVYPFFTDTHIIDSIRNVMDEIENKNLSYEDYSARKGLIWSDVAAKTSDPVYITQEYDTQKVTEVHGVLTQQYPQSICTYPVLKKIMAKKILPTMFAAVRTWTSLPDEVFAQIFFQRCGMSQEMDWHQDPGEDFDRQADYSLVLMLSDQQSADGWQGGEFKIRSGLPTDIYDEKDVETIIPRYNQAIIFNNQINCHAAMEVIAKTAQSKRDIIVVMFNMLALPRAQHIQQ
jgi:hypothetical protein